MPGQAEAHDPGAIRSGSELLDAVVIGTGFGGAVAACRLAQAGKRVCVLERGRRYERDDFPRPATRPDHLPHTARWAWALDRGLFDVKDLEGTLAVQAAGYGGGSLVYANVHLRAPAEVFTPPTRHGRDANGWPSCYSRTELDPYYDTVAAVLRVRPIPETFISTAQVSGPLPKVEAMRGAVRKLGRERWLFLPPLAIDFDACVMCGECIAGCQIHAKNTLDLNYLAAAERLGAEIRTLAEVHDIREQGDGYTVAYRDHILEQDATLRARSVFLCAGSVNSTHILLRSCDQLPGMPRESKDHIGRRFFVNGDAIAMVYDTAPAPTPTCGPTITTSLLYNHLTGTRGDWFMVQDGGYPKWLEPVLGLFRGELWLQRNRIERVSSNRRPDAEAARREAAAITDFIEATARTLLGVLDARRVYDVPTSEAMVISRFGLPAETAPWERAAGMGLNDILPPQVRHLYDEARKLAVGFEREHAGAVSSLTLEEIKRRIIESTLWPTFLVNQAAKLAEPHRLASTLEILHQYFLHAPPQAPDPFTVSILWPLVVAAAKRLFLGPRPDDHAFLMLVMGIDAAPGRLYLDGDQRLLASWGLAANARLATMQERLMHDVAGAMAGEMRLNPDASTRHRPVTVHNLGGCAMADRPTDGVTDPDGKAWGTRALYVLDGAAMPSSLGANPSATIAAVAERNVRRALQDKASPIHSEVPVPLDPPLPGGPSLDEIRKQLGQTPAVLDPIAGIAEPAPEPASCALGLKFQEVMEGFYDTDHQANQPIRAELLATIDDLNAFLVNPRRPVTITGMAWLTPARVEYGVQGTLDLLRRVETSRALEALLAEGREHVEKLAALRTRGLPIDAAFAAEEALAGFVDRFESQPRRFEMSYHLELRPRAGGAPLRLEGVKRIYGGPGLAPWTETTTLGIELFRDEEREPFGSGTMHVHLADLLTKQLPSFKVTGTEDDVRIAWAFSRFFRFFFGTLRQVYLPRLKMLDPFADPAG